MGTADAIENDVHPINCQAENFFHEVDVLVINRGTAQAGYRFIFAPRGCPIHVQVDQPAQLQQGSADATCGSVNQHALARLDASGAMHHLVRRDVVQHQADRFAWVQAGRHRHQFLVRQTDELGVPTSHGQSRHHLA